MIRVAKPFTDTLEGCFPRRVFLPGETGAVVNVVDDIVLGFVNYSLVLWSWILRMALFIAWGRVLLHYCVYCSVFNPPSSEFGSCFAPWVITTHIENNNTLNHEKK